MTDEERRLYVRYRLESAHTTYLAAKVLAEHGFWNSVVNRLYYALFYSVNALLVLNKIETNSHSRTKRQFSLLFVKTGRCDKKFGHLYSEIFDWRQKGDYQNIFTYEAEIVEPLFEQVAEMIRLIEEEINNSI